MKNVIRLIALAISISSLAACDHDSNKVLDDLNKNRAKWESANIDHYQFEYRLSCFCMEEYTLPRLVVVNAGQVVSQTIIENNVALPLAQVDTQTIAALFERIALEESRAESLTVEYDPDLGYPTKIQVDVDKQVADDEYTLYVSNVVNVADIGCTAALVSGLAVTVSDQSTQQPAACGVTITATEQGYSESVTNDDVNCDDSDAIALLAERPGFYSLTVQKPGYQSYQINDFGIGRDLCHVLPRQLQVELSPE